MKYIAVIKHNGEYIVSKKMKPTQNFKFNKYDLDSDEEFSNANKELRQKIYHQIENSTPFKNTKYNTKECHKAVSIRRNIFFSKCKIAIFTCNKIEQKSKTIDLPFCDAIESQCDDQTLKLINKLKWDTICIPLLAYLIYFLVFFVLAFINTNESINIDMITFIFVVINYFFLFLKKIYIAIAKRMCVKSFYLNTVCEFVLFGISLLGAWLLQSVKIDPIITKLGLAFLFLDAIIRLVQRE